jgi:hypothetical protein
VHPSREASHPKRCRTSDLARIARPRSPVSRERYAV